jgi:hypothetical protein
LKIPKCATLARFRFSDFTRSRHRPVFEALRVKAKSLEE